MIDNYIHNFNAFVSNALFFCFKYTLIIFTLLLILSFILLAVGCLIKSQKLKSKFLIATPTLLVGEILLLALPYLIVHIKNLI